ncbi:MATE family efflux transporter [Vibrio sp. T187]|uniref:MATE family efflux transporter n=1 Tax=Vibrio TaxID=662 RepID=UPI0010C9876C|nr:MULTISPECIES: MATE family efflux transporter [Vibrio]MBW3695084.1 MATE family efflux transporter [Vibrio sp. T187]
MENALLNKPVKTALLSMAAPAAFGMLMTFLFQLVDSYFVGQLGTPQLAAMSFAYPIYILIVSFFMGTAAGVSATVGRALGEQNIVKAQSLTTISLILFALITLVLGLVGYATIPNVFSALGASPHAINLITDYMAPLYLGMFALVGGLIANAALMSKGVMLRTTLIMAIGGIINVVFDYLLIFGIGPFPELALKGAAYATVLSWLTILTLMLVLLRKEKLLSLSSVSHVAEQIREVLTISTPAIAAQVLNPIAIAVITRMVSQYGDSAIAAYGIVTRIESLILTGILSLSVIITPLVAQNYGAKAFQRLDQIIAYSGRMTVYWGLAFFAVVAAFAEPILSIFTQDSEIIAHGSRYFLIIGITFPAFGLTLITTSFFNGVQQAKLSLKLTLVKSLMLTIPFAVIGSVVDSHFIWLGLAAANILGAIYAKRLLDNWLHTNRSQLVGRSLIQDYANDIKGLFTHSAK